MCETNTCFLNSFGKKKITESWKKERELWRQTERERERGGGGTHEGERGRKREKVVRMPEGESGRDKEIKCDRDI